MKKTYLIPFLIIGVIFLGGCATQEKEPAAYPVSSERETNFMGMDFSNLQDEMVLQGPWGDPILLSVDGPWNLSASLLPRREDFGLVTARVMGKTHYPIGVYRMQDGLITYYLDLSGDQITDTKAGRIVVPLWLVYVSYTAPNSLGTLPEVLDALTDSLQTYEEAGTEISSKEMESLLDKSKNITDKTEIPLYYALWFYFTYFYELPYASSSVLDFLRQGFVAVAGEDHPLLIFYKREVQNLAGLKYSALNFQETLKQIRPELLSLERNIPSRTGIFTEYPGLFTARGKDAYHLVINNYGANIRFPLKADNIQEMFSKEKYGAILDGVLVEFYVARLSDIAPQRTARTTDFELLKLHYQWEHDFQTKNIPGYRELKRRELKVGDLDVFMNHYTYENRAGLLSHFTFSFVSNETVVILNFPLIENHPHFAKVREEQAMAMAQDIISRSQIMNESMAYHLIKDVLE